jgi:hypothetical protein
MIRPLLLIILLSLTGGRVASAEDLPQPKFIQSMEQFAAREDSAGIRDIGGKLAFRVKEEPFLAVATGIFLLAILHTFVAVPITRMAHRAEHLHREKDSGGSQVSFKATMLHFAGEVEAIFGIWVVVLFGAMAAFYGVPAVKAYVGSVNFTEPLFVVVIMALASTRPILRFAEACLRFFARFGQESPAAWWLSILVVGPLLGSFITEPGAMTICAMLLGTKFYHLKPRPLFAYGTLGLLFVNISVGGVLTNFAAPPVLMVAQKWGLTTPEMLWHYGYKAAIAIGASTVAYFFFFRRDLAEMTARVADQKAGEVEKKRPIPLFVTLTHLGFMGWTVAFAHTPALFVGGFLFFLAFSQATAQHQRELKLRGPILVGFFLAALVIHGGLQGWWLAPIIASLSKWPLFFGSMLLTSFNDNAAITFLASQVQGLGPTLKYAVLAGAVAGGGLTVIANAPNPAGQALLGRYFGEGVSPAKLLLGALIPTLIAAAAMMLFPDWGVEKMFSMDDASSHPSESQAH